MSNSAPRPAPLLNSLLGMAILVAAAVDMLLLTGIGWAAWERATLSETWDTLRESAPLAGEETAALLDLLAGTESGLAGVNAALPTDADVARFVAALRAEAATAGVTIANLSAEPAPAGPLPRRVFIVRVQGGAPQLLALLRWTADSAPGAARIEDVALTADDAGATLSFRLQLVVRTGAP